MAKCLGNQIAFLPDNQSQINACVKHKQSIHETEEGLSMDNRNNITIGVDLGDKFQIAVVFDGDSNELKIAKVINTKTGVSKFLKLWLYFNPNLFKSKPSSFSL